MRPLPARWLPFLLSLPLALMTLHCTHINDDNPSGPGEPPVVHGMSRNVAFPRTGEMIQLTVDAEDPNGDALSYAWHASGGRFEGDNTRDTVTWVAPGNDGTVRIDVQVFDGESLVGDTMMVPVGGHTEVNSQTFGGDGNEEAVAMCRDGAGGVYVLANKSASGSGMSDLWWLHIDANDNLVASASFGGNGPDEGAKIFPRDGGGSFILGTRHGMAMNSSVWLLEVDEDGTLLNDHAYDPGVPVTCYDAKRTVDSGFIVVGATQSGNAPHCYVMRLNVSLTAMWQINPLAGVATAVYPLAEGNFLVKGYDPDTNESFGFKVGAAGEMIGNATGDDWITNALVGLGGGDVLIVGGADPGTQRYQVSRYTPNGGTELWHVTHPVEGLAEAMAGCATEDNGAITVGFTSDLQRDSSLLLVRLTGEGSEVWSQSYGGSGEEWGADVLTMENGYAVLGTTSSYGAGGTDVWYLRIRTNQLGR